MIASGTDSRPAVTIRLRDRVTGEVVDNELTTVVGTDASWRSDLIIDLSGVDYIDVAALMHVLAVLSDRARQGLNTYIEIPSSRRVRDFLRAWSFPTTAAISAGRPFRQLVPPQSHSFFGETPTHYTGLESRGARTAIVAAYERLLRDRFFSFVTYRVGTHPQASEVVEREWRRWTHPLVLSLLDRVLKAPGVEVPRVIVHELIANAIQHPEARTATLVARPVGLNDIAVPNPQLTIAIWDDGQSIIDTLRSASEVGSLRTSAPANLDIFQLRMNGGTQQRLVYADLTPGSDSEDEELLLASLLPGISRKHSIAVPEVSARTMYEDDASSYGFGLHSLYRCVIDAFDGTLAIRTGSYFMKVTKLRGGGTDSAGRRYVAEVKMLHGMPFRGNLIFVRLPLDTKIDRAR